MWRGKQIDGLRLVNGTAPTNGRLEVTVNGTAGSVCNYGNDAVAGVACRQLGLGTTGALFPDTLIYTPPPEWIRSISCLGSEARLQDCSIDRVAMDYYSYSCQPYIVVCSSGVQVLMCMSLSVHMSACNLPAVNAFRSSPTVFRHQLAAGWGQPSVCKCMRVPTEFMLQC